MPARGVSSRAELEAGDDQLVKDAAGTLAGWSGPKVVGFKQNLLKRLSVIADLADRIHVHEGDALKLLKRASAVDGSVFIYADPPQSSTAS